MDDCWHFIRSLVTVLSRRRVGENFVQRAKEKQTSGKRMRESERERTHNNIKNQKGWLGDIKTH